jgi:two-component system LytT family response regulator
MITAIIIDDEKTSRDTLQGLLNRYCKNVEVIDQADGYTTGIESVKKHKPEVIFLDIQMPDGSGFQLLEQLGDISFEVIFTTAYDQYAIKAIKYSALDYLLKPIIPDDLIDAVEKAEQRKSKSSTNTNIKVLLNNVSQSGESKKIVLSTAEKMHVIDIDDIIRCESDDYYTRFFFKDTKTLLISKTLKEHEELLGDRYFMRPHKSHLVNLKYIKSYSKIDGGYIIMSDGSKIPVSRRKKEKVLDILSHL